jgi:hypothetical protein
MKKNNLENAITASSGLNLRDPDVSELCSRSSPHLAALEAQCTKKFGGSRRNGVFLNRWGTPSQYWPDGLYSGEVLGVRPVDVSGRSRTPFESVRFTFGVYPACLDSIVAVLEHECPIDWREGSELNHILAAVLDRDLEPHEVNGGFYSKLLLGKHCRLDLARTEEGKRAGIFSATIRAILPQGLRRSQSIGGELYPGAAITFAA